MTFQMEANVSDIFQKGMSRTCVRFKNDLDAFFAYYIPLLIVIGLLGNSLSALTFMLTKLRKYSSSYYMTALSFADSGMLICNLILLADFEYSLKIIPGICQLTLYFGGVFSFLSVWYVVSFTLERLIAVRYPLRRLHWCTVERARYISVCIAAFACLFNTHVLVSASLSVDSMNRTLCGIQENYLEVANIMNYVDTVLTFFIPLILIIIGNTAIATSTLSSKQGQLARATYSFKKRRQSGLGNGQSEEGVVAGLLIPAMVSESFLGGELRMHVRRRLADDKKMTCTLLVVSLFFLFMNFPDHALRMAIYALYRTRTWDRLSLAQQCWITAAQKLTMILFNTNFAINFFLYSLVGANFRAHLKNLLKAVIMRPWK